jgi:uncharacterized membrane protein (UPF0127 family)
MKRVFVFAGLASGVFLAFFIPTFIFVSKGLATTTLLDSVDISQPSPVVPSTQSSAVQSTPTQSTPVSHTSASVTSSSTARFTTISVNGQSFKAEISDTNALQELGLSYRPSLPVNQVMLFVFPEPSTWGIWMKGMNFPLDILWLDANGTVVDLDQNVAASTYPNIFTPRSPATYVIEANVGWIAANNVALGTVVTIH